MSALLMRGNEFVDASQESESLVEALMVQFIKAGASAPSEAEKRSWRNSLPYLARDIDAAGLGDIDVFLEYRLPLTSQRVDVVLSGVHPATGDPSIVLVELKQWSQVATFQEDPQLLSVEGLPYPVLHPSRQVDGYRRYLQHYLEAFHGREHWVDAVAYVHGLTDREGRAVLEPGSEEATLFTGGDADAMRAHLRSRLAPDPSGRASQLLLSSPVAPSTKLMEVAAEEIRERERFVLLGEQQLAADLIRHQIKRAHSSGQKRVVIVSGGPGSGKSAIALSVLGELGREGKTALHATGSRSFTQTMRKVAGHRSRDTQSLFKYFNNFSHAAPNSIDVLIADEAHRIRETSNNRFTKADLRSDKLQIDELISVARVPVFLLDDNQVVRHGELGSTKDITRFAESQGYEVSVIELKDQFRCGGSAAYIEWVEQILGLTAGDPAEAALPEDEQFEVSVVESPAEMERLLRQKEAAGFTARISAGFCWPWSDPSKDGLVGDVIIGDWVRPWNNKGDRRIGSAPPSALWATEPGGFDQVGCVYTAQGFEFDWAGIILGPDIVWRDGHFETVRSANRDPQFRSRNRISNAEFDRLVRHAYKVLLTRGMRGTLIYSVDPPTRDALRTLLS